MVQNFCSNETSADYNYFYGVRFILNHGVNLGQFEDFLLKNRRFAQNQLILYSDLKSFFSAESPLKNDSSNGK